ncbi:multidrug effflux MFS transporter [Shewanella oneidensis MR-1]|uniref:Bcr/CflA family efflux transporter n=1 Tax=Shewanella oneidensis (strain ATCC 700550 / JCM 31522 / CIP 106686 / LMG 19005 / NCIMB 14063 / MR-1) TaxID=211586 RepID=Q8EBM5_SHEON|nr:multidrug effflux MFS transporter [Shewanella oneidensis]AAN56478.1 multidrug efflux pump EmrD3 [Shewanella oneidensis MR-1]MDX5999114.1 multidrug effflux MFS transporter [Shewanella oneidensis]MEE2029420.1 Inner membrane transport protein YdhC [Shewanella oneidensis]QKG97865.1 multidrug effflux MFS transporter [Shewanella oneidensis MR-1]
MNIKPPLWLAVLLMMFPQIMETIYSPALPDIAEHFAVPISAAAQTLSVYFVAFAIGVFCWGRLADVIGRRKAMLAGLVCYAIGSAFALLVSDFSLLLMARVLSAFGAAVGSVITQTMMRDSYSGEELAKVFSVMGMSFGISPVIGLLLGSVLSAFWGYQGVFVVLMSSAIVLLFLSVKSLPETKPAHTQTIAIGELAIKMLSDRGIIKNTLLVAAFNLMWFSYFSLAPFMFEAQGLSTLIFGMSGLLLGFGAFLGSYFNQVLLGRCCTSPRLIRLASSIALVGGVGIWLLQSTFIGLNNVYFLAPMLLIVIAYGIAIPNILSSALAGYRTYAGSAGALFGLFYYILLGAGLGVVGLINHLGGVITLAALFCTVLSMSRARGE